MAWSETIYLQFTDEAEARAAATALGVDFPDDGTIPSGNQNYALCAPMQPPWAVEPTETTPGTPESGYWAMLRLNDNWSGYASTMTAIEALGAVRVLPNPPCVFA